MNFEVHRVELRFFLVFHWIVNFMFSFEILHLFNKKDFFGNADYDSVFFVFLNCSVPTCKRAGISIIEYGMGGGAYWQSLYSLSIYYRGPPIDDVHTEGEGVKLRWTGVGGKRHVDLHTENYSPLTSSCLLLMQRSWCFWTRISSLDGRNKKNFSVNINS